MPCPWGTQSRDTHRIGKARLSPENSSPTKQKQRRLFQAEGTACAVSPRRERNRQVWGEFMVVIPRGKKDLPEAGARRSLCILESSLCLLGGGSERRRRRPCSTQAAVTAHTRSDTPVPESQGLIISLPWGYTTGITRETGSPGLQG